jgi:DNA-binding NarL/FixJ family response regulator
MHLDLDVGGAQAAAHLPALLEATPVARLVVLTGVQDPEAYRQAVRHGTLGLVLRAQAPATLLQALV